MDNPHAARTAGTLADMGQVTVDVEQLRAAAAGGVRAAEGAAGIAGALRRLEVSDTGRPDLTAQVSRVLQLAAAATATLAERTRGDADVLRAAAERYAAAEQVAGGGRPCA